MKKIMLLLMLSLFMGCTNIYKKEEPFNVQNYISSLDILLKNQLENDTNINYLLDDNDENIKIEDDYIVVEENGYKNIYDKEEKYLVEKKKVDKKGQIRGLYRKFDKNRNVIELGYLEEDGVVSGNKRIYYPNGKIYKVIPYYKNIANGRRIFYYENGNIKEDYYYVDGKEQGEGKIYYENGQVSLIENYFNGKLEGQYQIYDRDGKIIQQGIYKDGQKITETNLQDK